MALKLHGGILLDIAPAQLFVVVSDQGNQYLCFTLVPDEHQTVLGAMQQVNTQFLSNEAKSQHSSSAALRGGQQPRQPVYMCFTIVLDEHLMLRTLQQIFARS
ncbi:hypothetical protein EJB05_10607, partial [Eragrostis curvula]